MAAASTRPVFIVGCPRSGTTWLYHILLSAGGFAIYRSETQIYSSFGPCYGNFAVPERRAEFLRKWTASEYFLRSGLDPADFYGKAMQRGASPGAMLRVFMEEICAYQQAPRWAECTPDNARYALRIGRDFPDALFIHLVRDGRDVALSLARQGFVRPFPWHRRRPELAAGAYWNWIVTMVDDVAPQLSGRFLALKYEDLVTDTPGALNLVSDFIAQPLDLERIMRRSIGTIAKPNSSFLERDSSSRASIERWRSMCSGELLDALEGGMGDTLARHGYRLEAPGRGLLNGVTAGARRLTYEARFSFMAALKTRAILGRLSNDGLAKLRPSTDDDPTLRPGDHVAQIRSMIA